MRVAITSLFVATLTAACVGFVAAEPTAKPLRGRLLSRDELRTCMDRSAELERREGALKAAQVEHSASLALLSEEANVLSNQLRSLDNYDEVAVDTYNRRNDERNRKVGISNSRAQALNAAVADHQAAAADFMAECVSRPFLKSDEDALLKEGVKGRKPISREGERPARSGPSRHDS